MELPVIVLRHGGNEWLQERAVVGQALQLCSRERWAGCLPQAGRSGKSKIHPVKQKVGELLLVVHEVRSRGTCCWASCWSGGSASAAGSARGIAVRLGFSVQGGCPPWRRVTSAFCVPSPFSLWEVSSVLNQVSDLISQRSFKWGEIGVLISASLSTCSQV